MSHPYRVLLLVCWLSILLGPVVAQTPSLPVFNLDRRANEAYMDSLARLAHAQYRLATAQPASPRQDTLRLAALTYLGHLCCWWTNHKDSIPYYGNAVAQLARERGQVGFQVRGLLLTEFFYHYIRTNYAEAMRLNFQARMVLQRAKYDPQVGWRIDLNLGELYAFNHEYEQALGFLTNARRLINLGSGIGPVPTLGYKVNIIQKIAGIYRSQGRYAESEAEYLAAIDLGATSKTNLAYLNDDLAELYQTVDRYPQAIERSTRAMHYWESMNRPIGVAGSRAALALSHVRLGHYEQGLAYAGQTLAQANVPRAIRQHAHEAAYIAYEARQDWANSMRHYKAFIALSDSLATDRQVKEVALIQKRDELERLELKHQQIEQLQAQKLLVMQKQAQLDLARAEALRRKTQLTNQQHLLETERATNQLTRQRSEQVLHEQAANLRIEQQGQHYAQQNEQARRTRTGLRLGLGASLFFLLIVSGLYSRNQRQKRQIEAFNSRLESTVQTRTAELQTANEALRQKNRAIEEALLRGQTQERRRVATELHDTLGGTLAAVKFTLDTIDTHGLHPREQEIYHHLLVMVRDAGQQLRQLAHNLLPDQLQKHGLVPTLQILFGQLNLTNTVRFALRVDATLPALPKQIEFTLYAICLELCHNTLKHAGATEATLDLHRQNDQLLLLMTDNGRGFDPARVQHKPGMGLKNLYERAETIGASVKIFMRTEGGTLVQLRLPLAMEQPVLVEIMAH